jgi:hypothetical protein
MNLRNLLIATAALSAVAGSAAAQSSANASVPAKVTFVAPVAVTAGNEMRFGSFTIPTSAGGEIVLGTDGNATASGGGVVEVNSSAPQAATFTLAAATGTNVSLQVEATGVVTDYSLDDFAVSGGTGCASASTSGAFTFSAASCTLTVGATLGLPATASAGTVTVGSVKATLSYQ